MEQDNLILRFFNDSYYNYLKPEHNFQTVPVLALPAPWARFLRRP